MATYGDMQDRIALELHRTDSSATAYIKNGIKSAIKYYERERWYFNEATTSASLTTSSSLATYALPADFMKLDTLQVTISGWKNDVDPMPYIQMDQRDPGNTTIGQPRWWAVYGNMLRLYPIPDGTYVQTMSYQKRLTTLSATTDSNEWVDDLEELIRVKAKEIICRDMLRDYAQADRFMAMLDRIYANARTENDERLMSFRLTPHSI